MNSWRSVLQCLVVVLALGMLPAQLRALPSDTKRSGESVLPVWPGHVRSAGTGTAPEGSGVILSNGIVAPAWHVIEPASRITVRLSDGRVLPADLIGHDVASDIALLRVDADLQAFDIAPEPALADRACAVGNAFGLGLSITCGVVSATQVSDAGFNAVS